MKAMEDFYVDDLLTGADSIDEAMALQTELISLMKRGAMNLRKWTSNTPSLLNDLPKELIETKLLQLRDNDLIKALGIGWSPQSDNFQYTTQLKELPKVTKRTILLLVATIFDPCGWIAPVNFMAKFSHPKNLEDSVNMGRRTGPRIKTRMK